MATIKQKGLPIKVRKIPTKMDVGGVRLQALFYLDSQTLQALNHFPEKALTEYKKELFRQKIVISL